MKPDNIEIHQMWMRKVDHQPLVVMSVEGNTVNYFEYRDTSKTGYKSVTEWHEQCYLMGADAVIAETGGML